MGICLFAAAHVAAAPARGRAGADRPRLTTDGHLRPGHLETMHVSGFPGKGAIEVSFFPTAICEDECGARAFRCGRTTSRGAATFQVRVPNTFIDHRNRPAYFRDGERIDLEVTWEGPGDSFDFASAEPIIVRTHGPRRG